MTLNLKDPIGFQQMHTICPWAKQYRRQTEMNSLSARSDERKGQTARHTSKKSSSSQTKSFAIAILLGGVTIAVLLRGPSSPVIVTSTSIVVTESIEIDDFSVAQSVVNPTGWTVLAAPTIIVGSELNGCVFLLSGLHVPMAEITLALCMWNGLVAFAALCREEILTGVGVILKNNCVANIEPNGRAEFKEIPRLTHVHSAVQVLYLRPHVVRHCVLDIL